MMVELKDEELLEHLASGNEKALEALYSRYYHRLCDFAFKFLQNVPLTEEVVSDVFMNLWLKRSILNIQTELKPYLFMATRNQAYNTLKKERGKHEDIAKITASHTPHSPSTINDIGYKELEKELEELINALPEQRQLIFRLNRFEGLRYKEIAEILSISPHTVQNQMVKAIEFMANQYPKVKATWNSNFSQLIILFI